jgi:hypothetical protein
MPKAKELLIRAANKPGLLGEIGALLGAKKINVRAVNGWIEGETGALRLVVDKTAPAKKLLAKAGYAVEEKEILELELSDKPGQLGAAAKKLGDGGIDIRWAVGSVNGKKASIFLGVESVGKALKLLK